MPFGLYNNALLTVGVIHRQNIQSAFWDNRTLKHLTQSANQHMHTFTIDFDKN